MGHMDLPNLKLAPKKRSKGVQGSGATTGNQVFAVRFDTTISTLSVTARVGSEAVDTAFPVW